VEGDRAVHQAGIFRLIEDGQWPSTHDQNGLNSKKRERYSKDLLAEQLRIGIYQFVRLGNGFLVVSACSEDDRPEQEGAGLVKGLDAQLRVDDRKVRVKRQIESTICQISMSSPLPRTNSQREHITDFMGRKVTASKLCIRQTGIIALVVRQPKRTVLGRLIVRCWQMCLRHMETQVSLCFIDRLRLSCARIILLWLIQRLFQQTKFVCDVLESPDLWLQGPIK
jgi:hypothetical protein